MSLLADTSVWSPALRSSPGRASSRVSLLQQHIRSGHVVIIGIILQEVLQGIRSPKTAAEIRDILAAFTFLPLQQSDYIHAAQLFARCRAKGIQAGTIDCLIATTAIRHDLELLTEDSGFERIRSVEPSLKLL